MHYIHALCIFKLSITVSDLNIGQFLTLFSDFKRPVIYYLIFLMIFYLYIFMFKLKFWSELTLLHNKIFWTMNSGMRMSTPQPSYVFL